MIGLRRKTMRVRDRLTLVFSLIVFATTGVVFLSLEGYFRSTLQTNIERRAASIGEALSAVSRPHLLRYDYITLQQVAHGMADGLEVVYVIILDKEGKVAGHSEGRHRQGRKLDDPDNDRALIAFQPEVYRATWEGDSEAISVVEAVVPVRLEGTAQRWGTVRVGLSLARMEQQLWATRLILAIMGLAGVLAAGLASSFLARRITRPLTRLVEATQRLERGERNVSFSIEARDEIGELAQRFAGSAASLDRQKRELEIAKEELTALNATLEEKVEQRTAELSASREKYRLLVEGSPDAFVLLEGERLLFANSAFGRIFELNGGQLAAKDFSLRQVVHKNFHASMRTQLEQLRVTEEVLHTEWAGITASGRTVDLEARGRRVRYLDEDVTELVLTDVTEKKKLLQQVAQNERLRAMGEMTAIVAHHFNNILAVIHGRAQLVQRRVRDDEQLATSLGVIQSSVLKAGEMVRHLQDYFGEQVDLRFSEIDLNAILQEVASYQERVWRTSRSAEAPPVHIRLEQHPVPAVRGVNPLLQDVFRRILVNASEAMPDGGEIVIRTSANDSAVQVEVIDRGVGMTPDVQRRVFDPFFTTTGSPTRGLGLPASLGIVQRHEGRIEIESAVDHGTTVRVFLPVESRVSRIVPVDRPGRSEPTTASRES